MKKTKRVQKILSIDDEPAILRCFSTALSSQGYDLQTTSDPDEGLKILREDESICLVMLDIKMPRKSGFDIYREMRQFRELPTLFVTAYPASFNGKSDEVVELWKNQFADGATDIIYKPFELQILFEKVEGLIGKASDPGDKK